MGSHISDLDLSLIKPGDRLECMVHCNSVGLHSAIYIHSDWKKDQQTIRGTVVGIFRPPGSPHQSWFLLSDVKSNGESIQMEDQTECHKYSQTIYNYTEENKNLLVCRAESKFIIRINPPKIRCHQCEVV